MKVFLQHSHQFMSILMRLGWRSFIDTFIPERKLNWQEIPTIQLCPICQMQCQTFPLTVEIGQMPFQLLQVVHGLLTDGSANE
jgi:hypothetical protein